MCDLIAVHIGGRYDWETTAHCCLDACSHSHCSQAFKTCLMVNTEQVLQNKLPIEVYEVSTQTMELIHHTWVLLCLTLTS